MPAASSPRQRRDHVQLDRLLQELDGAVGARQEEILSRVNRLVFPHAFAEETVLWPVVRRVLPDGDALTMLVEEEEHQEVNELVTALERDGRDHPRRAARLARLAEVLREDVRDEEDVLFPRLQEALEPAELRRLGWQWQVARRVSPTRPHPTPHPTVSRRPPGNALSGLPLTILDRTRDLVDAGVRRSPERVATIGRAVSNGLAGLAARVEQIPASRAGDKR